MPSILIITSKLYTKHSNINIISRYINCIRHIYLIIFMIGYKEAHYNPYWWPLRTASDTCSLSIGSSNPIPTSLCRGSHLALVMKWSFYPFLFGKRRKGRYQNLAPLKIWEQTTQKGLWVSNIASSHWRNLEEEEFCWAIRSLKIGQDYLEVDTVLRVRLWLRRR